MKKIQNILTAIIVIAIIALVGIAGWIAYNQVINSKKEAEENRIVSTNTNETKNNTTENKEVKDEENNGNKQEYTGKEEEESSKEDNKEMTKDEKTIALAKKTWDGDDSVTFSIEEKKGFMYYVAVKSNATVISWYEVNTDTWEISEFY